MKLRILDNSIRIRLSQTEVDRLSALQEVHATTEFPNYHLNYIICPVEGSDFRVSFNGCVIRVSVPELLLKDWNGNETVSLSGESNEIKILVEKDFRCLTDRAEDESDLFSNPNTNC
ncbi:MAG: hypothetical protein H6606_02225 [Flavobacteriales bacterium]|nr:hypothetical protein [Flavobacteriales bacterium]